MTAIVDISVLHVQLKIHHAISAVGHYMWHRSHKALLPATHMYDLDAVTLSQLGELVSRSHRPRNARRQRSTLERRRLPITGVTKYRGCSA